MYAFRNSGFTREQLTNLGVTGKDVPIATQTPLFPPLISRPIEIDIDVALDYKVTWKEDFRSHLFDVHSKSELNLNDDSYSSKIAVSFNKKAYFIQFLYYFLKSFKNALEKEHKKKLQFKFAWDLMPAELRPQSKRKATMKPAKAKRVKIIPNIFVEEKLKILEQKEKENPETDEKSAKGDEDSEEDVENVFISEQLKVFSSHNVLK